MLGRALLLFALLSMMTADVLSSSSLEIILAGIPINDSEINLSNNEILNLSENIFSNFTLLRKLKLKRNRISLIENGSFNGLSILEYLILSYNELAIIPPIQILAQTLLELNLDNNRIGSLGSYVFKDFVSLRKLSLSNNALTSINANAFAGLVVLRHLQMSNSGDILTPQDGCFDVLQNLRNLDLSQNGLSHFPCIRLNSLFYLNIERNAITTISPACVAELGSIRSIKMNENALTSLEWMVGNLNTIVKLHVEDNELVTISNDQLANKTLLTTLSVNGNKFTILPRLLDTVLSLTFNSENIECVPKSSLDRFYQLGQASFMSNNLKGFLVDDCVDIHIAIQPAANLPNLTELYLDNNNITIFPDLSAAPKIKKVSITSNKLTDIPGEHLFNLSSLNVIKVSKNELTLFPDLSQLGLNNNLQFIHIDNNHLVEIETYKIQLLTDLKTLHVQVNNLTYVPNLFASNNTLENINIGSNRLTNLDGFLFQDTISTWVALKVILANYNQIVDISSDTLKQFSILQILYVKNNQLTELPDLSQVGKSLIEADFRNNYISHVPVSHLSKMLRLKKMLLDNNEIITISSQLIYNLFALVTLNLNQNNITSLEVTDYGNSYSNGATIILTNNPLHCDHHLCHIKMQREQSIPKIQVSAQPCMTPDIFVDADWDTLNPNALLCAGT